MVSFLNYHAALQVHVNQHTAEGGNAVQDKRPKVT